MDEFLVGGPVEVVRLGDAVLAGLALVGHLSVVDAGRAAPAAPARQAVWVVAARRLLLVVLIGLGLPLLLQRRDLLLAPLRVLRLLLLRGHLAGRDVLLPPQV